jgi:hypothetical protein
VQRVINPFTPDPSFSYILAGIWQLFYCLESGDVMAKVLVLTVVTGPQIGQKFSLAGRINSIGSSSSCDLVLHDRSIEPRHAELRSMLESWFVAPLTTSGVGLSVNGIAVRNQSRVRPGDKLSIGTTTYAVTVEELVENEVGSSLLSASSDSRLPRLGEYLVQRGLLTKDQVRRAADRQSSLQRIGVIKPFGEVAYELGYLNRSQLDQVVGDQRNDFNDRWSD